MPEGSAAAGPGRAPAVLVVDDDEGLNRLLCRRLVEAGYHANGVHTGGEALAAVELAPDVLLLLDYMLPDAGARELVLRLREQDRTVPFIVMTGRGDEREAVEMMKLGARDYVTKQVDFVDLMLEVVQRVMRELEGERALASAEAARRESERRLAAVLAGVPGAVVYQTGGGVEYMSENAEALLGYPAAEFAADRTLFPKLIHPEDRAGVDSDYARWKQTGYAGVHTREFRVRRRDGEYVWLRDQTRLAFVTPDGRHSAVGVLVDVTESRAAAQALRESEERFRSMFAVSPFGMALTEFGERPGAFVSVNRAFCVMLGYTERELTRLTFADVTHPDDLKEIRRLTQALLDGTAPSFRLEKRYVTKSGDTVWAATTATRGPRTKAGTPTGLVVVENINERRQAEVELEQYRRRLEELVEERTRELRAAQAQLVLREKLATLGRVAGSVAHELRNPLAAARNASYYLQQHAADRLEGKPLRHLQVVDEYIERADRAIATVLDFTQGRSAEPASCALRPILDRSVADAALPAGSRVLFDIPAGLPRVVVDDRQMVVVFRNLLTNAAQAMPKGGTIRIAARHEGGDVVVSVADTGEGIAPEHMSRLFEPLFTTRTIGIGLGLAICRAFVEANGGSIAVESEVGVGSTFSVTLPLAVTQAVKEG